MNRYRLVFKTSPTADVSEVDYIDAPSAADAIAAMGLKHEHFELISIRIDVRDPAPTPPPAAPTYVVLESLARALVRCNTVLLALLGNSIFAGSLTPARLASLQQVTRDAQLAIDLAKTIGVEVKP